jgi:cardiolipin synthase
MNLPNNLSLLRILLVPVFVGALFYYNPDQDILRVLALSIFVAACLTDAADGYLARKLGQKTVLGSYLDPLADKALLLSGFLSLSFMPNIPEAMRIPAWVTITIVARDLVILLGSIMIYVTTGTLKAQPLLVGKVTTFFQMGTLVAALLLVPAPLQQALNIAAMCLTVISGAGYLRMGERILR